MRLRRSSAKVIYEEGSSDGEPGSKEAAPQRACRATRKAVVTDSGSETEGDVSEADDLIDSAEEQTGHEGRRRLMPRVPSGRGRTEQRERVASDRKEASKPSHGGKRRGKRSDRRSEQRRRSGRSAATGGSYVEADSDDEFAQQNLMYGSDEEQPIQGSQSEGESTSSESISYHVERILASRALTPAEWRSVCDSMNTREVSNGSVWKQPEDEYLSDSPEPVQKFLIKWAHSSYLHVSWETERDLTEMAGPSVKAMLSRFAKKSSMPPDSADPFSDLRAGEYVPPSFLVIERILDVEDPSVDVQNLPHEDAYLPGDPPTKDGVVPLHSDDCFVIVKWEGLAYSDTSFESIADIRSAAIDYEVQLRAFYRREQRTPAQKSHRGLRKNLDLSIIESSDPPPFPGGTLRDYQWEGVRWLMFNWTQKRNSILADEMVS